MIKITFSEPAKGDENIREMRTQSLKCTARLKKARRLVVIVPRL
jgi:hypothetical protein